MPNKQVYNQPAENLKVIIYGQDNNNPAGIDRSGNLLITGFISLTSLGPVNLNGLTIGTAIISNTLSVSIPTTVSVSVVNTPSISGTLSLSGNPTFMIGGLGFTQQITTISVNTALISLGTITTPAINVGSLSKYGYYIQTPSSIGQAISVAQQVSYTTTDSSFVNAPEGALSIAVGGAGLVSGKYMQYSRLRISGLGVVTAGGSITAIFQGQV